METCLLTVLYVGSELMRFELLVRRGDVDLGDAVKYDSGWGISPTVPRLHMHHAREDILSKAMTNIYYVIKIEAESYLCRVGS